MSQNNPPGFFLYAHGSHTEHRTRMVQYRDNDGNWRSRHESYTETITDFDFQINVSQYLVSGPVHWSVADEEPAFRGQMFKEVDGVFTPDQSDIEHGREFKPRREATSEEIKSAKAWRKERRARGLPPWVGPGMSLERWNVVGPEVDPSQTSVLKSSKTLRQWADEYCASKKHLKEFTYERVCHPHFPNCSTRVYLGINLKSFSMSMGGTWPPSRTLFPPRSVQPITQDPSRSGLSEQTSISMFAQTIPSLALFQTNG